MFLIDQDPYKFAEFIGIMLGDGYFVNDRLKISFHAIDELGYIEYVRRLIFDLFSIDPILKFRKNENTADLFVFRRNVLRFLYEVGLVISPKWGRAKIPSMFKRYGLDVLRGYFDTDGSVVITNNNGTIYPRLEMKISPSPMQNQFIKILKKQKFRFGVYHIGKGKIRIQLNGVRQLSKWVAEIGFRNQKHLTKLQKFKI